MKREAACRRVFDQQEPWDVLVIGGGASGLGAAVEAAARGYRTLLVEQHDFAKGTSSRSTKLIHGGVRYLKQGNVSLVLEALRERGLLCANAPHLVRPMSFVIPAYRWWELPFYGVGLKVYDLLAGKLGLGPSRCLSRSETVRRIPTIDQTGLRGGVIYQDGQFDDARLAINLAQTIFAQGGVALNYVRVTDLRKDHGIVCGACVRDEETGEDHEIAARAVINATGVFADGIRKLDDPSAPDAIRASQGAHLVLPREFLPGETALMVPHTPDGRVLFAIPWHERVIVGTTDIARDGVALEPLPMAEEVEFLLANASRYLNRKIARSDVLSVYAGLRPLVRSGGTERTAALSRDHAILLSGSRLITIIGGKWTTYRKMGEDVVDQAERAAGWTHRSSPTKHLRIHGWMAESCPDSSLQTYGSDSSAINSIMESETGSRELIHPRLPYTAAQVLWGARTEMARTVEDVLARRTRALLLDARASLEAAPRVAALMAKELGHDSAWETRMVAEFAAVATGYVLS